MLLGEIKAILDADVLTGEQYMDSELRDAFAADSLNDILEFAKDLVAQLKQ